jgi:pimeloyl-ACP methyl ester carboxylesterase
MTDFALPETHYALSGDVNIAYQTMGEGPIDIILVPGFMSHIEFMHELPGYTAFLRRLSSFSRVVTFDKRGQGLSDRVSDAPSLEQRMDDVRAVMDAVGSDRATLFGISEGCAMSALFAATYPDRASRLILFGGYANRRDIAGEQKERALQRAKLWGTGAMIKTLTPDLAENREAIALFGKLERLSASPGAAKSFALLNALIDVSSILPTVRIRTALKQIGLPVRAGLHTGEIEMRGGDVGGVAVHVAARVMTQSQPDEVLVSRVLTDLVAGAGLTFSARGSHELKGLPGQWELFAAS